MKKFLCALLPLALCLSLAACSLAQPAKTEDTLVGLHIVAGSWIKQHNEAPWVETADGRRTIDGQLVQTQDRADHYIFPGLEGRNMFMALYRFDEHVQPDLFSYHQIEAQRSTNRIHDFPNENQEHVLYTGTCLYGTPTREYWENAESPISLTAYPVYQRPDLTVYLEEVNSGYGGGGTVTYTWTDEQRMDLGPSSTARSFEMQLTYQDTPRVEAMWVVEFDENNRPLARTPVEGELFTLTLQPETAWAAVEEALEDGDVRRTALSREELTGNTPPSFWPLDEAGLAYRVTLRGVEPS